MINTSDTASYPRWNDKLKTAATSTPMSRQDVKDHLRLDTTDDDNLVDRLTTAATHKIETDTGRALFTQTWTIYMDDWPRVNSRSRGAHTHGRLDYKDAIIVTRPPLSSVSSIKYKDVDGTQQTLAASQYQVDTNSEPGRIMLEPGSSGWPALETGRIAPIEIEFICGYGSTQWSGSTAGSVPAEAIQAMLLLIGHWYENRESVIIGTVPQAIQLNYLDLIGPITMNFGVD
jgi:uncharacterized phiE125 gp8 family phage protein